MHRRFHKIILTISIVILVGFCALWVRSYWRCDKIICGGCGIRAEDGLLVLTLPLSSEQSDQPMNTTWLSYHKQVTGNAQDKQVIWLSNKSVFMIPLRIWMSGGKPRPPRMKSFAGFGYWQRGTKQVQAFLPLWFLMLLLAISSALWLGYWRPRRMLSGFGELIRKPDVDVLL